MAPTKTVTIIKNTDGETYSTIEVGLPSNPPPAHSTQKINKWNY